jgi:hypothetical protein
MYVVRMLTDREQMCGWIPLQLFGIAEDLLPSSIYEF